MYLVRVKYNCVHTGRDIMVTRRLDIRLDQQRRRKLRDMASEHGDSVSGLIRRLIDRAYAVTIRARRQRAAY